MSAYLPPISAGWKLLASDPLIETWRLRYEDCQGRRMIMEVGFARDQHYSDEDIAAKQLNLELMIVQEGGRVL